MWSLRCLTSFKRPELCFQIVPLVWEQSLNTTNIALLTHISPKNKSYEWLRCLSKVAFVVKKQNIITSNARQWQIWDLEANQQLFRRIQRSNAKTIAVLKALLLRKTSLEIKGVLHWEHNKTIAGIQCFSVLCKLFTALHFPHNQNLLIAFYSSDCNPNKQIKTDSEYKTQK